MATPAHTPIAYRARYIFPVVSPPLRDGLITIAGDRIVSVGENLSGRPPIDLGEVALLPGFVNAHTHLEFSELDRPLGQARMPFCEWLALVVQQRRAAAADNADWFDQRRAAIARGVSECAAAGVVAIGEIATRPWSPDIFNADNAPVDTTVFLELIGLSATSIDPLMQVAREHLSAASGARWRVGLSPHAPYTVHPDLLRQITMLSRQTGAPVAMHLAESIEELELLQSGSGPFVTLLRQLEAWDPTAIPRGIRPGAYLQMLANAARALVIHGNYLADDEIEFLAAHADSMSVVYCPRTHEFFGHGRYPLPELLAAGVNVALGTDSRASNPDLQLLSEMQLVRALFPELASAEILRLATLNAARALGREDLGALTPGRRAALIALEFPGDPPRDPHDALFAELRCQEPIRCDWRENVGHG
jgi:cytosine/adenosine deaminase-related metal-dependent hydrolase